MDDIGFNLEIPCELENLQLPSNELLNFYYLKKNRIFYIDYEIDISILEIQREIILINMEDINIPVEKRIPIKILLDCPGGLLSETMSLIASIKMSKTPIYTINMADAYSGGAMILMAGHKRYAMPYSKAMIHTGSSGLGGTYEQVESQSKKYKKEIETMGKFIMDNTKIDSKLYKKNKAIDWYMDENEQVQYGLVDEIIDDLYGLLFDVI